MIKELIKKLLDREKQEVKNWEITQEDIDKDLHLDQLNDSLEKQRPWQD